MLVWSGGRGYVREVTLSDYLSDYLGLPLPPHRAEANHNIGITLKSFQLNIDVYKNIC